MVCIWDVRWLWQFRGDRLSSSKVHSWMLPAHSTMVWGKIVEVRPGRRGKRCHLPPTNTTLLHPPRCWHNCNCAPPPMRRRRAELILLSHLAHCERMLSCVNFDCRIVVVVQCGESFVIGLSQERSGWCKRGIQLSCEEDTFLELSRCACLQVVVNVI